MTEFIFDFETLSTDRVNGVVVNLATLAYEPGRFKTDPYAFSELVESCKLVKFDVADQRANGRVVDPDTVAWWKTLPVGVQKQLVPSSDDLRVGALYAWFVEHYPYHNKFKQVWCRGNTFDMIILDYLMYEAGHSELFVFWKQRDTRSFLDGLLYGSGLRNSFMPEGLDIDFVHHDPCHDIALDVFRMQSILSRL